MLSSSGMGWIGSEGGSPAGGVRISGSLGVEGSGTSVILGGTWFWSGFEGVSRSFSGSEADFRSRGV